MQIRIALAHLHPCTKFGVPRSKGVRAEGRRLKTIKLPPGGTILTPRGWFSQWRTILTKALLTWKLGLPATSRLGCSPDTTFFEGFTRRHVARATWHVAPRGRRHRRSVVPAHRMSRLPSGSAQLFRRYSRNPCLRWPLSRRDPAESSVHFCHQIRAGDPVGVVGVQTPMGPCNLKNCGGPWGSNIKIYINTWAHQKVRIWSNNININKFNYIKSPGRSRDHSRFRVSVQVWSKSRSSKESSRLRARSGPAAWGELCHPKGPSAWGTPVGPVTLVIRPCNSAVREGPLTHGEGPLRPMKGPLRSKEAL